MKSLKEHLSEALADRNGVPKKFNKNLHAKMTQYARHHIGTVADDIEQGVQDATRMMGRHNAGSVYHGVEDHLADHLHDKFHKHPGYGDGGYGSGGISLARHVAKQVTKQHIHDDRPEYHAAVRKQERREKAAARPPRERKEPRSRATATPTTVNVWTKSGTVQRTMKLPPFRK